MDKNEKLKYKQVNKATEILKSGGVVLFPTDTVYGIGAIFDNKKAVERIYQIKQTPVEQNFPILISDINQIKEIVEINSAAGELIKKYWPGALTLIMNLKNSGNKQSISVNKVGIRMPDSDTVRALIAGVKSPIIGTSANIHGEKTPATFKQLNQKIVDLADFTIEGLCGKKIESTVVDTTVNPPKILRQGAIKINAFNNLTLKINTTQMLVVEVVLEDQTSGKVTSLTSTQKKGSQVLLPMIIKLLKASKKSLDNLTLIEVNPGPGSFTGTRVGVAVANALGYALDLPVNGKKGKIVEPIYEKSKFD